MLKQTIELTIVTNNRSKMGATCSINCLVVSQILSCFVFYPNTPFENKHRIMCDSTM